jgi:hypothetical protein
MRYLCTLLALLCAVPLPTQAAAPKPVLDYKLVGLEGKLEDNANAWLGAAPVSVLDRLNYVAPARDRGEDSLVALGY